LQIFFTNQLKQPMLRPIKQLMLRPIKQLMLRPKPCQNCGGKNIDAILEEAQLDFDTSILPWKLRNLFETRYIGTCGDCGLCQNFSRFSEADLDKYLRVVTSKLMAISEQTFRTFPVPEEVVRQFEDVNFKKRFSQWDRYFPDKNLCRDGRYLFIRPMLGAGPEWMSKFSTKLFALEICDISRQSTQHRVPQIRFLDGNIHAKFFGDFLNQGPFDGIFIHHVICHSIDLLGMFKSLRNLLSVNGFVLFSHEITWKFHNPFHTLFFHENQWVNILLKYFDRVDRIDDCLDETPTRIAPYTIKKDCPDHVAWRLQ